VNHIQIKSKGKGKDVPVHAMKSYRARTGPHPGRKTNSTGGWWVPQPVLAFWVRKKFVPVGNQTSTKQSIA